MNTRPDTEGSPQQFTSAGSDSAGPANWRQAIATLVTSRIALIQLEARESVRHGVKRALRIIAAILCLFFGWTLLLAGTVTALSAFTGWAWHWVAIAAALAHLIGAAILVAVSRSSQPMFSLTRAEFKKDRQWFENLQNSDKSSN